MGEFFADNWFEMVQTLGIALSFGFGVVMARKEIEARKISNLNAIINRRREIRKDLDLRPELKRVESPVAGLEETPLSFEEERFVNDLIIHLDGVHRAMKAGVSVNFEQLPMDIREFFSLPVPRAVWEKVKRYQNRDFVSFIDEALKNRNSTS